MAVMMPREKWTDERLDDGFDRLDKDIRELRAELKAQGESLRAEMNARFEALNRNMIAGLFVIVAATIGSNAF